MKKTFLTFLLYFCFQPWAYSQADDDLIIISEEDSASSSGSNSLSKYFSGEVLASYAGLVSDDVRYNAGVRLKYAQTWNSGFSLVGSVYAYTSNVEIEFEETIHTTTPVTTPGEFPGDPPRMDTMLTVTTENTLLEVSSDELELREGYIRFNNNFIDIYAGRRVLALGQFNAFSPVDFVLPIDLSDSKVEFTKLANKYPQTTVSLHLYPVPQLELQLHYFPKIERDPTTRELLEKSETYLNAANEIATATFSDPDDEAQYIGRVVYNGRRLSAALTYYKGFELYPSSRPNLILDSAGNPEPDQRRPEPSYTEITAYGFEVAIPYNRFSFKYEALLTDIYVDFPFCRMPNSAECGAYHTQLNRDFDGKAYGTSQALLHAVGFDYSGDDWTLNIALYNAIDMSDSKTQNAIDMGDLVSGDDYSPLEGVFPGINIARHYGANKKHTTGFGGGLLGSVLGLTLYQGLEVNENLTLGLSAEALSYQSDVQAEEQAEDDAMQQNTDSSFRQVEKTSAISPAIRFTLVYTF